MSKSANAKGIKHKPHLGETNTRGTPSNKSIQDWPGLIHEVPGFRTAAVHCGLKRKKIKPDIGLILAEEKASAAAVYTTNMVRAAPVDLSRDALALSKGTAKAVIVNAGNANACTGRQGERDARKMATLTAKAVGCPIAQIQVCSTGIIGQTLPMKKIEKGIAKLGKAIAQSDQTGDFARAILTTDLVSKTAGATFTLDGKVIRMAGVTKGSGMIAPRMATTLGFIATDAAVSPPVLQAALSAVADETFNCITVDGDTSTNDTLIALASGKASANQPTIKKASGRAYRLFRDGLLYVCDQLARQVAADGEGAHHTVTLFVGGTRTTADARKAARAVAESPLVKTAIAGHDPNWGRIMAAAGRSGISFDPKESSLTVCGHELYREGGPVNFDAKKVSKAMQKRDVSLILMLGNGPGHAKFYTCDLTEGYVRINTYYST